MNLERLQKLRSVLVEIAENGPKFNLRDWGKKSRTCGTTCCAIGWYALATQWNAWQWTPSPYQQEVFMLRPVDDDNPAAIVAEHFGISEKQVAWLFYPEFYPASARSDPRAVMARIDQLVAGSCPPLLIYDDDELRCSECGATEDGDTAIAFTDDGEMLCQDCLFEAEAEWDSDDEWDSDEPNR